MAQHGGDASPSSFPAVKADGEVEQSRGCVVCQHINCDVQLVGCGCMLHTVSLQPFYYSFKSGLIIQILCFIWCGKKAGPTVHRFGVHPHEIFALYCYCCLPPQAAFSAAIIAMVCWLEGPRLVHYSSLFVCEVFSARHRFYRELC